MNVNVVGQRTQLTQVEQINILVERIQVLEGTIQMISYNLRCLNIRQRSQPTELPTFQAPDKEWVNRMVKRDQELLKHVDMVVSNPDFDPYTHHPYEFGSDEEVWAK